MGDNKPESQRLSLQIWVTHSGHRSCQHLARKDLWSQTDSRTGKVLSPAGQSLWPLMPGEIGVAQSSTLVRGARLSQQRSGICLSYTLKEIYSTLF